MNLSQFESDLENLIGRPTGLRPFVCDGSPLTCRVFIVGINPATDMTSDFWSYWRPGTGFDRGSWFEAYKRDRAREPLKQGRTRRNPVSSTRRIIDLVVDAAKPVRILETNLYSVASPAASGLPMSARSTEVFDFLLRAIQPTLIVAHGSDAATYIKHDAKDPCVWPVRHLSRAWSFEQARELGARIRSYVSGAQAP